MSSGLDGALTTARRIFKDAVTVIGTTVTIERDTGPTRLSGTVDPDSLLVAPHAPDLIATAVPAIVVPGTARMPGAASWPATVDIGAEDYQIFTNVDVDDLHEGDLVTVTASRDPSMVGLQLTVRAVQGSSAGTHHQALARPTRLDTGRRR